MLFIIYINDLPQVINSDSHILTFADDTKLVSKISSSGDKSNLQNNLNRIIKWSEKNNMKLNNNKFEFLSHDLNTTNHKLTLLKELPFFNELKSYIVSDNIVISPSTHVRDLGVIIDNKLTWNIHYNTICKKAKQLSAWILHTFYSRDKSTMLVLFKSLIRSRLD